MQLAINIKTENRRGSGVPWPPAGSLGNAPYGGPGQKQYSQKPQEFDVLKA